MAFSYYFKNNIKKTDLHQYIQLKNINKTFHTKRIKNNITSFPNEVYLSTYFCGISHEVWHKNFLVDIVLPSNYFSNGETKKTVEGLGEITIEDNPIIGHNIVFDYSFINEASLSLYGREITNRRIDTLLMFKEVFPEEKSHGLSALLKRFNVTIDKQHRALSDAYSLALVYEKLRNLYKERYSWQFSQLNNIDYLFERYLRIQTLMQSLQSEMGDIKSVFKLYFDNGGQEIKNSSGDMLSFSTKFSYQYDLNKLKKILEESDLIDKTLKINIGFVERLINSSSLDEELRQKIIGTRINISELPNVLIQKASKLSDNISE